MTENRTSCCHSKIKHYCCLEIQYGTIWLGRPISWVRSLRPLSQLRVFVERKCNGISHAVRGLCMSCFWKLSLKLMFFICSSTKGYRVHNRKKKKKKQGNQPKHRLTLYFTQVIQLEPYIVGFASFREHGIDKKKIEVVFIARIIWRTAVKGQCYSKDVLKIIP